MGHVRIKIKLANFQDWQRAVDVDDALVDTGATFTTIPRSIAQRLGLQVFGRQRTRTAAGPIEIDQSYAYLEYDGHSTITPVWISDTYPGVLIGVFTLEGMALAVDPKNGRLVDSELLLL